MKLDGRNKGILMVLLGGVLWGTGGVAGQYVLQKAGFSTGWLVTTRMSLSGLLLLMYDALTHRGQIFQIWRDRRDMIELIIFGVCGLLAVQYSYYACISASNAAAATVLQYLMPVVIVLWTALRTRHLPARLEMACVALAMVGTFFLVTHGSLHTLAISGVAFFWGVASAVSGALYTVLPKRLIRKWRASLVVGWGMFVGGIFFIPLASPFDFVGRWDILSALVYFYIIIFGTVIAFSCYLGSLRYLQPGEAGVLASVEPLAAIVFSVLLLAVPLTGWDLGGAALILASVILLARK